MKSSSFVLAAAIALSSTLSAAANAQMMSTTTHYMPDVKILKCFITKPKLMSKNATGTQIEYSNMGTHTYSGVTFAVGYRNSANNFVRRVHDVGTFAPGAVINHHFTLYSDVTYGGSTPTLCGAISATH